MFLLNWVYQYGLGLCLLALSTSVAWSNTFDMKEICILSDGQQHTFLVEIADTDSKRAQGLMGRNELAQDTGMLFVYSSEALRKFWMYQTYIYLDIAFVNANLQVLDTMSMAPCRAKKADYCPLFSPGEPYQYALEVKRGTFKSLGIKQGATLQLAGCTDDE